MMKSNYIYGKQANLFGVINIPIVLFREEAFKDVSVEAKLLYGLMVEKMDISSNCRWLDEADRVYIVYPTEEMMEDMNCSKAKVLQAMQELERVNLLERKLHVPGRTEALYPKKIRYICENTDFHR